MATIVSVIIVTYNSSNTIEETLDSILNQRTPHFDTEVLVVDGGSTDGTLEIVDDYPVDVYRVPNGTIGKCRNTGIRKASGDYIAFTDSDCRAPPTWLQSHLETLNHHSSPIVGVGGPNVAFSTDPEFSKVVESFGRTILGSGGSPQSYGINETRVVKSVPACNVLYDSRVFDHLTFDDDINIGEDAEFHYRLTNSKFSLLYDPENEVEHHLPDNIRDFFDKNYSYGKAMARIQMKHRVIIRWYSFLPSIVLSVFILSLLDRTRRKTVIKSYTIITMIVLLYGITAVYNRNHGFHSLLVLLLLPLQYIGYALGFINGIKSYL